MKIKPDVFIKTLVSKAYPEYRGRKFFLQVTDAPIDCASYWDGGSRDYFTFANLSTGEVSQAAPAQSGFDRPVSGLDSVLIPENFACIKHSFFCGKDTGITIYIRTSNAAKFLPQGGE